MSSSSSSRSSVDASNVDFDDIDLDRYEDAPWDRETNVAVSALTKLGVLMGNDDGTFAAERHLNRAEFVTIIMRLIDDDRSVSLNCFPDVSANAWYAEDVCRAKALGIVRGNVEAGLRASEWRFEPARDIQYEEAVKILVELYELSVSGETEGMDWYVPYLEAANNADLHISGLRAGDRITRGEMAHLAVGFVAWSEDRLDELREAESRSSSSSSRSSSSSSSRMSSSSSSSSSSSRSSSSVSSAAGTVRSHILLLGEISPTLASVDFFSNSEPIDIDEVTITFSSPVESIGSMIIYDQTGLQIGTATAVTGSSTQFRGTIPSGKLLLPYREERGLFVKARLKSRETGGVSGDDIRVANISVEGEGQWTSERYTSSSSETFPTFESAFARITGATNAGSATGIATAGTQKVLADLQFTAQSPETLYDARLTSLVFIIEQAGGVTLSNVTLRNEDNSASTSCTVSSTTVTCGGIDPAIGTVDDTARIRLYGDVSIPSNATNARLRLVLNDPGTPSDAGDITWTDGVSSFTWLDLDQPVVAGTDWD
jgi:hypothetical protein